MAPPNGVKLQALRRLAEEHNTTASVGSVAAALKATGNAAWAQSIPPEGVGPASLVAVASWETPFSQLVDRCVS
jgi:hypothetical protein